MSYAFPPPLPRPIRKAGAPLAIIIILGTIAGLILILLTAVNPAGTALGFILSTVAMSLVLLAYLWLDRWEPEPPSLLILAFLWGASVAVVVSVALEMLVDAAVNTGGADASPVTIAFGAPVIEEAAKGLFLLLMMTGARRNELNSLTDCLVYAGVTAVGFAWLEDIFYISDGATLADSLVTAAMRLIMGPFAHPLFTTFIAIGVYFALQQRNWLAKVGWILLGYLAAVIMHGLWNGSALLGPGAYFGLYVVWMMPVFALAITLAVRSRRREQRIVAEKLPGMVAAGLVTPAEAGWLGSIRTRKQVITAVTGYSGRPAARGVRKFAIQVVELAFVRDRIDRGFGDARVFALQQLEVDGVVAARTAAGPVLHWLNGYRPPVG
ncbi:PrsW family intramembrane metalloprotease [Mycobacterium sp. CVI_P3]|uniref:PrsW family intramembrane metalloprotease n=1 Tax=Mycobacterium pinniadriaticum TaxID=2994102 RepID=A0ABT3SIP9_9MYCO|nr:PrsW family intramembrane metalloprotease [Mycobacterium pinniadriaticum]MCX2932919.1 PrsW family intramembrane metalloprotease [Mycobacterium pinniadriaticum]MCX2939409.1 PrsW family intramembrane metalloprotease [Mycobacterium pinniadriaticum]